MKRFAIVTAAALLALAAPASAQFMNDADDDDAGMGLDMGGGMQINKDACSKIQYTNLAECKNIEEGRSSVSDPAEGTVSSDDSGPDDNNAGFGGGDENGGGGGGPGGPGDGGADN